MEKKREYKSPSIKVVSFKDHLMQGEWIVQGSPTDEFSKGSKMEMDEEEDFSNNVWGNYGK